MKKIKNLFYIIFLFIFFFNFSSRGFCFESLLQEGKYSLALEEGERSLRLGKISSASLFFNLSFAAYQEKDYVKSLFYLRLYQSYFPQDSKAKHNLKILEKKLPSGALISDAFFPISFSLLFFIACFFFALSGGLALFLWRFKFIWLGLLSLSLFLGLGAYLSSKFYPPLAIVKLEKVPLLSGPGKETVPLGIILKGTETLILDRSIPLWARVKSPQGIEGWVLLEDAFYFFP